jgi:hypothetical protein
MAQSPQDFGLIRAYLAGMKRLLVCGGRVYSDRAAVYDLLDSLHAEHSFSVLIAGGARGVDTLAEEWARDRSIPTQIYQAIGSAMAALPARFAMSRCSRKATRIWSWRSPAARARPA